ncbi:MAG: hypothetical protein ACI8Y4_002187 [Candidatus Poriferisodalaceae bacterium]
MSALVNAHVRVSGTHRFEPLNQEFSVSLGQVRRYFVVGERPSDSAAVTAR